MRFELFADEAWTHTSSPLNRYWCFFGGFLGAEARVSSASDAIRKLQQRHDVVKEIGWKNLSAMNAPMYRELVDFVETQLDSGALTFRQMFLDRRDVYVPEVPSDAPSHPLDVQFKMYYQFLKHMFGCEHLPQHVELLVRLDTHSSQQHKDDLEGYTTQLPSVWRRRDIDVRVSYHRSAKVPLIQAADLLMGAAGSYGNKQHLLRDGRRGMSPKQRIRYDMAKYVYEMLRRVDCTAHRK